ncbi:Alpha/Beta hydrolase protein [Microdochium trichocladiopsis]|uniref:Alpha/Beta hydrolase protein n=1 Tax=Microdochium trichocladiopsis TaxID=1682393 RepID=A0A9P9BIL6_9PEZI|nr:Alpha/Beta hydrolase protein [Microdochium trichocladiopsis]KAH7024368.1 Alpha/Beta hydrolase protein [Microdochium trichocladiopsis]
MVAMTEGQKAVVSPEAVDFLTKLKHLPFASLLSGVLTMPSRITSLRETVASNMAPGEAALIEKHDLRIKRVTIGGVPVVVIEPPFIAPEKQHKIMFNVFGGGFTLGSPQDRAALITAAELGVRVYSPDITRSPEARYPVARDQCLAVYRALIQQGPPGGSGPIDPADIYAQGSSSGGQILLSMLIRAHMDKTPLPTAGLYLCTPAADLSGAGDSLVSNARDRDVLPGSFLWSMAQQNYPPLVDGAAAGGSFDDKDPEYSPVYYTGYEPSTFPRTVITVGTRDFLMSSGIRMYWRLRDAGVEAELLVYEGMWHGFNWDQNVPEAKKAREDVFSFLERRDITNKA